METRGCDPRYSPFRRYLITQPASVCRDDEPFVFLDMDDLEAERRVLQAALPHPHGHPAATLPRDSAMANAIVVARLAPFGDPPTPNALTRRLAPLSRSASEALHLRLDQLDRAIHHARHFHGRDYDPTRVVAVNPRWDRRWEALLSGALLVAYLGFLSVENF